MTAQPGLPHCLPPTDPRTLTSSQEITSQSPRKEDLETDDWPPAQQWPGVTPRPLHTITLCQGPQEVTRASWVPEPKVKATTAGTSSDILSHSGQSHLLCAAIMTLTRLVQKYGQAGSADVWTSQSHLSTTTQKVIFPTGRQLPKSSSERVFCKQLSEQPTSQWKDNLTNQKKKNHPKQSPPSIASVSPCQRTDLTCKEPQKALSEILAAQQRKNPTLASKTQQHRKIGMFLPSDTDYP